MNKDKVKKRIFVDAHVFDNEFQGTVTFLKELYTQLENESSDLEIYYGVSNAESVKRKIPSVRDENILIYKKRMFGFLRYFIDIPKILEVKNIDFAHFQYIAPKRRPKCSYIVTLHDVLFLDFPFQFPWHYRWTRKFLFHRSFLNARLKTTVSEYSKKRISHHFQVPATDISVIPNGVSEHFGNQSRGKKEAGDYIKAKYNIENIILYVSRIEPRKNHLMLLESFLELELYAKSYSLVFIGKESIPVEELSAKMESLPEHQKKAVVWLQQVSQDDLEHFYKACKLFVFPSKGEGFGIPPLEAGLCLSPVICSSVTAMEEFRFFDPYRFDPENKTQLKSLINRVLTEPSDNVRLANIRSEILVNYSWKKSAEKLLTIIKTCN
jgi:glycosyltransferase involved in cell wall biosynthesis